MLLKNLRVSFSGLRPEMSAGICIVDRRDVNHLVKAMDERTLWASLPVKARLSIVRKARHELALHGEALVDAMAANVTRTRADSLVAEVLPLLAAVKFLEQQAETILQPRRLGRKGLPPWLTGLQTTVERAPFGSVLVIAPGNYPLFLAGVQTFQALVAGNSVVWKPGRGGRPVAILFARALEAAGLPAGLLRITEETPEAAICEMQARPDKVFLTGSLTTGREVLRMAAETLTPVVMELSGCDAVVVLPSADLGRVVDALTFGMRLNGSATCMAPRRLILVGRDNEDLVATIIKRFEPMSGVMLNDQTRHQLRTLLDEAKENGAVIHGDVREGVTKPILVVNGTSRMRIAQTDIFAPVLTVIVVDDVDAVVDVDRACPFGLTMSIFGDELSCRQLGKRICVGSVLINDLIVPTADPRIPFGGRRNSGFGSTRGREGLLEMTTPKVIAARTSKQRREYQPTTEAHEALFQGVISLSYGAGLKNTIQGARKTFRALRSFKSS